MSPYDFVAPRFVAGNQIKNSWKVLTRGIDFSEPDRDEVNLGAAIRRSEGIPRRHRR